MEELYVYTSGGTRLRFRSPPRPIPLPVSGVRDFNYPALYIIIID
jgi:hypothetical protein